MRTALLLPLLLAACGPAKVQLDDTGGPTGNTGDADTDTDGDTDADADGDTDTDTDADTDTEPTEDLAITDLSWRLHDEIESMVYVSWTQNVPATMHVEYSFDKGTWMESPSFAATAGAQEQVLVGIPFETDAAWRVVSDGGVSADGPTLTTGDLPDGLPLGEVTVADESQWLPGANYLMTTINENNGGWTRGTYWTFVIDRDARVVWAHVAPDRHWSLYATVSVTKDYFMWDESTYWSDYDDGAASQIHKRYLDEAIEDIATPGLHHEFVQLPDETLVWGSQDHGGGEALVEQPMGSSDQTIIWTCNADWPGSGRCESNGLFYNEATNTYLYSFYTNNSIVEVDRATGESLWWAGDVDNGYDFDPSSSQYSWQHGVSYTSSGTLLCSSEYRPDGSRETETWLLEYEVDRANGVLHNVWGSSSNTYAETNGDAWRLSNGNTLHVVGAASVIREVNPDGDDVWRVDFHGTRLLGRGEFIEDLYTLVKPR